MDEEFSRAGEFPIMSYAIATDKQTGDAGDYEL